MKSVIFACVVAALVIPTLGLQDYMNTPIHDCVKCLCHAVSGCYIRQNCARYSISKQYWIEAGSPVISQYDDPNQDSSYQRCIQNENCIIATIWSYTDSKLIDCNCDGTIDCKDRLAIHLSGSKCINPKYGDVRATRFNNCVNRFHLGTPLMRKEEGACATVNAV